ncbi:LysR Transcriptional regulator [Flavobacteriaceae bacterium]
MDLRNLNYFQVLAEELHFGRAAERLNISQPPLSRMIKQLEDEFGVLLFERTKRKVLLTSAGEELLIQTKQMISQMALIKKRLKIVGKGESGNLLIGYVGATMHTNLPNLLSSFYDNFPEINMSFEEQPNINLIQSLNNGTMDVAFVRTWLNPKNLEEKIISTESLIAVLPVKHNLSNQKVIKIKDLDNENFISFARDCGPTIFDNFLELCSTSGFAPKISHQATQLNSILRLVECGFGISLLPMSISENNNSKLKFIQLDKQIENIPLIMLYRKENSNPSLVHLLHSLSNQI